MRLFLFDVDGTLVSARGAGRRAVGRALEAVYGATGPLATYDFRGKTDPQIIFDLMGTAGLSAVEIAEHLPRFYDRYVQDLRAEIGRAGGVKVMPGIAELVGLLGAQADAVLGLLTGNIEAGARIKLEATGLLPHFRLGAYGSDAADRARLPAVAARRAEALAGRPISPERVVIIGDTPLDIACARAFGARAVSVATGGHRVEELAAHAPDVLFADFADVGAVLAALLDGRPGRFLGGGLRPPSDASPPGLRRQSRRSNNP
ncbi:MAG: HAD family hydrolase [Candidatus Rokubacteria bacterium]|nr:HAD family hydrolase [Candidatus Rokubacteria bacterium]